MRQHNLPLQTAVWQWLSSLMARGCDREKSTRSGDVVGHFRLEALKSTKRFMQKERGAVLRLRAEHPSCLLVRSS